MEMHMTPPQTIVKATSGIKIARVVPAAYAYLVRQFPPREINNRREYDEFQLLVVALMKQLSSDAPEGAQDGIRMYLNLLTPFIKKYEDAHWNKSHASPREVLAYLMDEHDLNQADLKEEIGSQPYVSDILKGKKDLTLEQVSKLAKRFNVSPTVFIAEY